jgi:arylsulfatase A-like enzyme
MSTSVLTRLILAASKQSAASGRLPHNFFASLLLIACWFGIVTGLLEGFGLLLFQRINWRHWGPMIHVSPEILWISPTVDLMFFLSLALLIGLTSRFIPRIPPLRALSFLLIFLATYDWATLTARLNHRACLLLALGVAVAFGRWIRRHEDSMLRVLRRSVPGIVIACCLAFTGVQGGTRLREKLAESRLPAATPLSPNVLVIVVDTLRADHLSSYGYARPTSPNIDRLASEGVLFENAVSSSSWSLPSHVSLLTGEYLYQHGVGNVEPEPWLGWRGNGLGGSATLGEALQQRGYRTAAFSANRTYFSRDLGFGRSFIHFEDYFHSAADAFVRSLYGREFARLYLKRTDKSLIKRTLRALGITSLLDQDAEGSGSYGGAFGIRKRAQSVNDEVLRWVGHGRRAPFFIFVNYFDVHDPYGAPRSYPHPQWEKQGRYGEDQYDYSVKYVDDCFGQLMQELSNRGLTNNTLVVVTSDHGESLGQHHLQTHGRSLYWNLVHVPLIISYSGHIPAGIRIITPVSNVAVGATVLKLIGSGGSRLMLPGPSLDPLWAQSQSAIWPVPFSELVQNRYFGLLDNKADGLIPTAATGTMASLVTPQWHLISHEKYGVQLYDWLHDPEELNDLAGTTENRSVALRLESQVRQVTAGSMK